jgi:hypothetical protein
MFYSFAPGALVVRVEVIQNCEDFYYMSRDGTESSELRCGDVSFEVINVVDFLPPPAPEAGCDAPCLVDRYYSALFRMKARSSEIFCIQGVTSPDMNEFKQVYDHYGFKGLNFHEIWTGSSRAV